MFQLGQVVKYDNGEKLLYYIVNITKYAVDIKPLSYDSSYTILNVSKKIIKKVPYKTLLLTKAQYKAVKQNINDYQRLDIYISAENKPLRRILCNWHEEDIIKCYTTESGYTPIFVNITDFEKVIHVVRQRKEWIKMPAFKLTLFGV